MPKSPRNDNIRPFKPFKMPPITPTPQAQPAKPQPYRYVSDLDAAIEKLKHLQEIHPQAVQVLSLLAEDYIRDYYDKPNGGNR